MEIISCADFEETQPIIKKIEGAEFKFANHFVGFGFHESVRYRPHQNHPFRGLQIPTNSTMPLIYNSSFDPVLLEKVESREGCPPLADLEMTSIPPANDTESSNVPVNTSDTSSLDNLDICRNSSWGSISNSSSVSYLVDYTENLQQTTPSPSNMTTTDPELDALVVSAASISSAINSNVNDSTIKSSRVDREPSHIDVLNAYLNQFQMLIKIDSSMIFSYIEANGGKGPNSWYDLSISI